MKIHSIHAGTFKLDGGAMFGVVPKTIWNKVYPSDDNNLISLAMRCLLIETAGRIILIDNGIGEKQDERFFSHYEPDFSNNLIQSLQNAGYQPEDITDVFLTHLHFDHCGGTIKHSKDRNKYELTFPNANHWVSKIQWEWATKPNRREKASFLTENIIPILESRKLNLFDDGFELLSGFNVRLFHGHTGGQAIPFINTGSHTIVFMADTIPTLAHLPLPYIMSYDTQPLISLTEKESLLNEAAEKGYILFFEHDAYTECCTVERTEKGIKLKNTFSLEDIFINIQSKI